VDERRRALIIATDRYEDASLDALQGPVVDADTLRAVLSDPGIGAFETTHLINKPHYAVRQAIEDFVDDSLPSDLLLVYFSGHGVKDEGGNLFLAASDTRRDRPRSTGVEAGFVDAVLRQARARRQVLILDCCFSGAFPVGMASKSDGTVVVGDHLNSRGRVVLASSNSIQYSFEGNELVDSQPVGSVFTQALVSGLQTGDADLDGNGEIDVDELYEYIYDQVAQVTPNQTPQKTAERIQGEILIARNPFRKSAGAVASARAQEARAELLRVQLTDAMAARSSSLPEARHAAILAMSRIALSAPDVDPEMTTEIAAALGSLTLDADPEVALAAQTELERLTRGGEPAPSPAKPQQPPQKPDDRRKWLGWAVAGVLAVAATVLGVALLTDRFGPDEVGGVSVTTSVVQTAPTTVTVPAPETVTVEVPPNGIWPDGQNWIDTGIVLQSGDEVSIEAEGEATHDGTSTSGPEGDPDSTKRGANLPELSEDNHNALVARIGDFGEPWTTRSSYSFIVGSEEEGVLYLGVNDVGVENNTGKYIAYITVGRP
jgi:uncharacterized caspase-like protein